MTRPTSAWPPCALVVGLAVLLGACERASPPQVARDALLEASGQPVALLEHTVAADTRPATRIEGEVPVRLHAGAGGTLRLAVAPDADRTARTTLQLALPGGRTIEQAVGVASRWQELRPPPKLGAGQEVALSVSGGGAVWVADPRIERPRDEPVLPLVVVILVDTIRADHTSLDGYALPTSPNLEALADDGVAFLRAYVPAPWTRPSVASLLTSLQPDSHLVGGRNDRLRDDLATWTELARELGYRTVAWATNPNVIEEWGFAQGFARFVDLGAGRWQEEKVEASEVYRRALESIDAEALPLFLYLHVLDPHHPYEPPAAVATRLHADFRESEPGRTLPPGAPDHHVASAVRRYDGEILDADDALGDFLEGLRVRGLYDDAALVVVGDHGEEFREHGGEYHGHTLYEEQLRVPMVLKLPERTSGTHRDNNLVSILDALPTVAAAAGWPALPGIQGKSLLPLLSGDGPVHRELVASTKLDGAHAYALITPEHKLIRRLAPTAETLLFHLDEDPGEQRPSDDPAMKARLETALERRLATHRAGWHVRACGGANPAVVRFAIEGLSGEPRRLGFEAADQALLRPGGVDLTLAVDAPTQEWGWGSDKTMAPVPDEDEIVFAGGSIGLRAQATSLRPTLIVGDAPAEWSQAGTLDTAAAVRPPSRPPSCPGGAEPTVLVWYVQETVVDTFEPDADLEQRLRGLGYLSDD